MSATPWLITSIVILIILGVIFAIKASKSKKSYKTDYYTFFIIGIIWLPFGIIFDMPFFFIMGLVFLALGLVNKDKWKPKSERYTIKNSKFKWALLIIGLLVLIFGVLFYFLAKNGAI